MNLFLKKALYLKYEKMRPFQFNIEAVLYLASVIVSL